MISTAQRYLRILKRQPRPWRFIASRILWRTRLCSLFQIDKGNYRLKFYPTALSAILWINPHDRAGDEFFLTRYLKHGDKVIDVGANIGHLALDASTLVGSEGRVYCVEAHPRTYKFLRKNVALNRCSNIAPFNLALGNSESEIYFSDTRGDDQNHVSQNGSGIRVKMIRLDDLPMSEGSIELLKIDVEGYEKFVLEGAPRTLRKVSCIYIESDETHFAKYGYGCADVIGLLQDSGFTIFRLTDDGAVAPIHSHYSSAHCENLIAVRNLEAFLQRTGFRPAV